jgi:hypothetical protein
VCGCAVLGIELVALHMVGKHSTTALCLGCILKSSIRDCALQEGALVARASFLPEVILQLTRKGGDP